jgi:hypothetical protein
VIQEADILRCDDKARITFQYRDAKTGKMAQRTLPGADFLWHVLQHVCFGSPKYRPCLLKILGSNI